jgi:alpha-beta hydrolase superfamily lysophospholipase
MDRIPTGANVHLIGHSLGGVVSRYYVQELGGHRRVTQTISLSSPFGGAHVAKALRFFMVGADLHRESAVLKRLRASSQSHDVPHTSIVAGSDRLISGFTRAVFPGHEAVILHGRGHNSLLYDEEVIRVVVDRVKQSRRRAPARAH